MRPARLTGPAGPLSGAGRHHHEFAWWILLVAAALVMLLMARPAHGGSPVAAASVPADSLAPVRVLDPFYEFPSARRQFLTWAWNAAGPAAVGGNLVGASWRQWVTEEPSEWGAGWDGFGKRFGAGSLTTFVGETSLALGSAAMREDPGYYRSPRSGLWPRTWHAVRMTFMARRPDGTAVFSPVKTLSPFAGPLVAQTTVYPDHDDYAGALVSGAYGLLITAGWNAAREFVVKTPPWGAERPRQLAGNVPRGERRR